MKCYSSVNSSDLNDGYNVLSFLVFGVSRKAVTSINFGFLQVVRDGKAIPFGIQKDTLVS